MLEEGALVVTSRALVELLIRSLCAAWLIFGPLRQAAYPCTRLDAERGLW